MVAELKVVVPVTVRLAMVAVAKALLPVTHSGPLTVRAEVEALVVVKLVNVGEATTAMVEVPLVAKLEPGVIKLARS